MSKFQRSPKPEQLIVTRAQAATLLGVSRDQVRYFEREGLLESFTLTNKPGSMRYIRTGDVRRLARADGEQATNA